MKTHLQLACVLALFCFSAIAQIPNSSFENWSGNDVVSWPTTNGLMQLGNPQTVFKSSDAHSGNYACEIITAKITTKPSVFVPDYAGSLFCGKQVLYTSYMGFPFTEKPKQFSFWYKYNARLQDSATLVVGTSRWNTTKNSRDTLSFAIILLTDSVDIYTKLTTQLNVFDSVTTPDTAYVLISAAGNNTTHGGARLLVDDVAFEGGTLGEEDLENPLRFSLFPNPMEDGIVNLVTDKDFDNGSVCIQRLEGKEMFRANWKFPDQCRFEPGPLSPGIYLITVESKGSQKTQKLMVR